MATIAEKKEKMGYRLKGPSCQNCKNFTYREVPSQFGRFIEWKNKRCLLGGFATTQLKWCENHVWNFEVAA